MKRDNETRSVWPRVLGVFLAVMLMLTLLSRAADSIMLPVVELARPLPGALTHTMVLVGVIEAREQWPVMAEAELPVARVHVRVGQSVQAGDALLSYDGEAHQRKLDEKEIELKKLQLEAQLETLEGSTSGADYKEEKTTDEARRDQEKASLKQQLSRLLIDRAQGEVDRLLQLLDDGLTLTAPADGTVSELLVKPGDVTTGAALRLSPASSGLWVRTAVTEDQKKHLQVGMEAPFQRSGDARISEGTAVLNGINPTAAGYEAGFDLPDGAGAIGQTLSITATHKTETYPMRVPLGAIASSGGMTGVYRIRTGQGVLGPMEYAEFMAVAIIETDAQYAAIEPVLSEQDQVIASSNKPISAGDRVRSSP